MNKKERLSHLTKPNRDISRAFDNYFAKHAFREEVEDFIVDLFAEKGYRKFSQEFLDKLVNRAIEKQLEPEQLRKILIDKVINKK